MKCAHDGRLSDRLRDALFGEAASFASGQLPPADTTSYPHTHLPEALVRHLFNNVPQGEPLLVVECGSFVGGSACRIARALKAAGHEASSAIVCIDPFCGDANMWSDHNGWREWLRLQGGRPRLFEQFVSNVLAEGHEDVILPLCATACVGMSALLRLIAQADSPSTSPPLPRPGLVYLDSAHEEGEVLLELRRAHTLLAPGGWLLGDDYAWAAVQSDVLRFASQCSAVELAPVCEALSPDAARLFHEVPGTEGRVAVTTDAAASTPQWLLVKPANEHAMWGDARGAVVQLAHMVASGKRDLPDLAACAALVHRSTSSS